MVLTDRRRLLISSGIGLIVYILILIVILLVADLSSANDYNFGSLVYIRLDDNPAILPVPLDDKDTEGEKEEILTPRKEDDKEIIKTPANISNTGKAQAEKTTEAKTEAASMSNAASSPAVSSGSGRNTLLSGESGGAPIVDSGAGKVSAMASSFSSQGAPRSFSSDTTKNSDTSFPDFPDNNQNSDFFQNEAVGQIQGAVSETRTNKNNLTPSSGSAVKESYEESVIKNSSRSEQGKSTTEGLGQSEGAGTSERGGEKSVANNSSEVITDNSATGSGRFQISEQTGSQNGQRLTGTEGGSPGGIGNQTTDDDGKIGNDQGEGTSASTPFEINWNNDNAGDRKLVSSPDLAQLRSSLATSRNQLPSITVTLRFMVTPQGAVMDPEIISGSTITKADQAFIAWLRLFKFESILGSKANIEGTIKIAVEIK